MICKCLQLNNKSWHSRRTHFDVLWKRVWRERFSFVQAGSVVQATVWWVDHYLRMVGWVVLERRKSLPGDRFSLVLVMSTNQTSSWNSWFLQGRVTESKRQVRKARLGFGYETWPLQAHLLDAWSGVGGSAKGWLDHYGVKASMVDPIGKLICKKSYSKAVPSWRLLIAGRWGRAACAWMECLSMSLLLPYHVKASLPLTVVLLPKNNGAQQCLKLIPNKLFLFVYLIYFTTVNKARLYLALLGKWC